MNKLFLFRNGMIAFILILSFSSFSAAQPIPDSVLKKNIAEIDSPLEKLLALNPKIFEFDRANYKHLNLQSGPVFGFMSEDVVAVFPELVKRKSIPHLFGKNLYRNSIVYTIDDKALIPVIVASIQEQQGEIDKLKMELAALKQQLLSQN